MLIRHFNDQITEASYAKKQTFQWCEFFSAVVNVVQVGEGETHASISGLHSFNVAKVDRLVMNSG